ncbi:MAG: hypothetical protein AUK44_05420 [Porphyromonadaceae bacterium CG2_30_38_12]|nr:MAG: hypothetical protein AUK44_05420 [Porphyromonadaceae bacterium CG2_30_38_12]
MIAVLQITIPAILVLLTAYVLLDKMLKNDAERRLFELKKKNLSATTPLRLRAYERLTLVLERTAPATLILDVFKPAMTCFDLQAVLLTAVRQEFSHNVSQQIYVSNELWTAIRAAQESLVKLVNICAAQFPADENGTKLAEAIIQIYAESGATPTEIATELLKKEVRNLF